MNKTICAASIMLGTVFTSVYATEGGIPVFDLRGANSWQLKQELSRMNKAQTCRNALDEFRAREKVVGRARFVLISPGVSGVAPVTGADGEAPVGALVLWNTENGDAPSAARMIDVLPDCVRGRKSSDARTVYQPF